MLQLLLMWAIVEVLGFICLPLTMTVFHNLPDSGAGHSARPLGLPFWPSCLAAVDARSPLFYSQLYILGVLLIWPPQRLCFVPNAGAPDHPQTRARQSPLYCG